MTDRITMADSKKKTVRAKKDWEPDCWKTIFSRETSWFQEKGADSKKRIVRIKKALESVS